MLQTPLFAGALVPTTQPSTPSGHSSSRKAPSSVLTDLSISRLLKAKRRQAAVTRGCRTDAGPFTHTPTRGVLYTCKHAHQHSGEMLYSQHWAVGGTSQSPCWPCCCVGPVLTGTLETQEALLSGRVGPSSCSKLTLASVASRGSRLLAWSMLR